MKFGYKPGQRLDSARRRADDDELGERAFIRHTEMPATTPHFPGVRCRLPTCCRRKRGEEAGRTQSTGYNNTELR